MLLSASFDPLFEFVTDFFARAILVFIYFLSPLPQLTLVPSEDLRYDSGRFVS